MALVAGVILAYKVHATQKPPAASASAGPLRVLLVANLSEANIPTDNCSKIIHLVQAAGKRGIAVKELNAGSKSQLLARYHVLVIPTVLIFGRKGKVVSRYQGESLETVAQIRTGLARLH